MTCRIIVVVAALVGFLHAAASAQGAKPGAAPALTGFWAPQDRSAVIEVAPCPQNSAKLCAVVVKETLAAGEPSLLGQVVVKDLAPKGKNKWRGRYVVDGSDLGANARLTGPSQLEFQICLGFFCETETYTRTSYAGDRPSVDGSVLARSG